MIIRGTMNKLNGDFLMRYKEGKKMSNISASNAKKQVIDFTKGSPFRLIMAFYWPLLLTSMLQQLYNFADTWLSLIHI